MATEKNIGNYFRDNFSANYTKKLNNSGPKPLDPVESASDNIQACIIVIVKNFMP